MDHLRAWVETLRRDLVSGFRASRHDKAASTAAVLTLAVVIALNTSLFAVVNSLLLRPLAVADAGRVVRIDFGGTATVAQWQALVDAGSVDAPRASS